MLQINLDNCRILLRRSIMKRRDDDWMSCFTDYQNGRSKPFNGDIWFISWSISISIDWSPCSQFDNAAKYVQLCLLRLCIILWSTSHRSIKFNLRSHKLWTFNCFIKLGPMPPYGRRPRLDRQVRIQLGRVNILGCSQHLSSCLRHLAWIGAGSQLTSGQE